MAIKIIRADKSNIRYFSNSQYYDQYRRIDTSKSKQSDYLGESTTYYQGRAVSADLKLNLPISISLTNSDLGEEIPRSKVPVDVLEKLDE